MPACAGAQACARFGAELGTARIQALEAFAAIDPQVAKKERAKEAATKRAAKLEAKLAELRKVIES